MSCRTVESLIGSMLSRAPLAPVSTHSGTVLHMLHMYKHEHKVLTHPLPKGVHQHFSQKQITGCVQQQTLTPHSGHLFHTFINAPHPPSSLHRSSAAQRQQKKTTLLVSFLRVLRCKTFRRVPWLSSGSPASSWADLRTPLCSSPGLSAGAAVHTVSKKQPRPHR